MSLRGLLKGLQHLLAAPERRRPAPIARDAAELAEHYKRQSGVGK